MSGLSTRQAQILRLLSEGAQIKVAATTMGIAVGTAKLHREAAMAKLGARTSTHAVALAVRQGLI